MNSRKRIPIDEAAKTMQTTPLNVLMHIKHGLLAGAEDNGVWMIDGLSLAALMEKTGGSKDVRVCAGGCAKQQACGSGCG